MKRFLSVLVIMFSFLILLSCGGKNTTEESEETDTTTTEEENEESSSARVYFIEPQDGEQVQSPVKVVMGVEGMEVNPAGEIVENTGHHHLIINGSHVEEGEVVPTDSTHIHFGDGQTETEVELEAGSYTLTLQFADGLHQSYGEDMSATINIEVVEEDMGSEQ